RIAVLETQAYHHEWQRQESDNHATGAMMRIHVLEARARIDTLEDTGSSIMYGMLSIMGYSQLAWPFDLYFSFLYQDYHGVTLYVVDMTVEMGKNNSLDDIIISGYFPPLSMPGTITVGNAPGKSLYANITGKPSEKKVNVRTLYTPKGNGIDVVVPVDSIH
ncbi:hypothetical protein Tco_0207958, partial [Tanacetum coccineum]